MSNGFASSVSDASPCARRSTMARLVGSAIARKIRSSAVSWLSTYLSKDDATAPVKARGRAPLPGRPVCPLELLAREETAVDHQADKSPFALLACGPARTSIRDHTFFARTFRP